MLDRDAFAHADPSHQALDPVAAENPHQIVFEAQVKPRRSGIALAPGPAPELVVDPAGFVALGSEDVEASHGDDPVVLLADRFFCVDLGIFQLFRRDLGQVNPLPAERLAGDHFIISSQEDVHAAAGHVGRDGHRPGPAGLGDDPGFLLVVLGVEDDVFDALAAELCADELGFLDRGRPDQDRAAERVELDDFVLDGLPFFLGRPVDDVGILDSDQGLDWSGSRRRPGRRCGRIPRPRSRRCRSFQTAFCTSGNSSGR